MVLLTMGAPWPATAAAGRIIEVQVYRDENGNHVRDRGESGWPGVVVGHGFDHHRSDRDGRVVVSVDATKPNWLHVQAPPGAAPTTPWYLSDTSGTTARFGLQTVAGAKSRVPVVLVQISDLHVGMYPPESDRQWMERLVAFLHRMQPPPDLVLATGDLTHKGLPAQYERLLSGFKTLRIPIRWVMGNHDRPRREARWGEQYERWLGPIFYGFNLGPLHITVHYSMPGGSPADVWMRLDGQWAADDGQKLLLAQHHYPGQGLLRSLSAPRPLAVLSGHWHGNQVLTFDAPRGPLSVNLSTTMLGGWDFTPPGVLLLRWDGQRLSTQYRLLEQQHWLKVVTPDEAGCDRTGKIVVVAADGAAEPEAVDAVLKAETAAGSMTALRFERVGPWLWSAALPASLPPGRFSLRVEAHDAIGARWNTEHRFRLAAAPAVVATEDGQHHAGDGGHRHESAYWSTFRGDSQRSGKTRARPALPLALQWVAPLGGEAFAATPLAVDGQVFAALADQSEVDAPAARVVALDAQTGAVHWSVATGASVRHAPTWSKGRLIVQLETGVVLALDGSTGALLWRRGLASQAAPHHAFHWAACPPLVRGDFVVVCGHRVTAALRLADGEPVWSLPELGREDLISYAALAAGRSRIYRGSLFDGVVAYDWPPRAPPTQRWQLHTEQTTVGPVVTPDGVLVQTARMLSLVDPETGKPRWSLAQPFGPVTAAPVYVAADLVVAATASRGLLALDPQHNRVVWQLRPRPPLLSYGLNQRSGGFSASPALAGRTLFATLDDGRLVALDVGTGHVLWQREFGVPMPGGPAFWQSYVYVMDAGGTVYAFRPAAQEDPAATHRDAPARRSGGGRLRH